MIRAVAPTTPNHNPPSTTIGGVSTNTALMVGAVLLGAYLIYKQVKK